ncbi:MAG: holo-[acyl-carrier protein] synthase [Candidatus Tokpelaia sp. JSC161]|jgi:holo-[acyl-carrier protein] synthase|nr:MAG: holo-[acyl-carrier protein] synthase [Candidatus Tokpelaia sp. JSC161]
MVERETMIFGIGSDLFDIRRMSRILDLYGNKFTQRVFTQDEQLRSERRNNKAASYAKRFSAKEACAKALGTGFSHGITWRDFEVVSLPIGKPLMKVKGKALRLLKRLVPRKYETVVHLSMTDDYPWVQAFVIIEALSVDSS